MASIVDILRAEGMAKGKAEGKAEGEANTLVTLVRDGDLSRAKGILRLQHLHEQGQISAQLFQDSLAKLNTTA